MPRSRTLSPPASVTGVHAVSYVYPLPISQSLREHPSQQPEPPAPEGLDPSTRNMKSQKMLAKVDLIRRHLGDSRLSLGHFC